MTNPKAPWPRRTPAPVETQSPKDVFLRRLALLGASPDLVTVTAEGWDDPDFDRDRIVGMSDDALRAEIEAIEAEHYEHTHTPEQEAADLAFIAATVVEGTIEDVVVWLDRTPFDKADAAAAVWAAEAATAKPRVGVETVVRSYLGETWEPGDGAT